MKTCALIPAYNEEKNIVEVIDNLKSLDIFPVVVDDCSLDATAELAEKSGAKVIRHRNNKGKGEAIKTGLRHILRNCPETEHIVLIDADMQYHPKETPKILQPLKNEEADFVSGFRNWSTVPFRHRLGNFVWKNAFNILFGTNFKDTNCGFMALTRNAAKKLKGIWGGYIIENALFIEAIKNNLKIKQVPVNVKYFEKRPVGNGIKTVSGVLYFIVREGLKYRLGIK